MRHRPASSEHQLFCAWIQLLQIFEVLVVWSPVDCCVELEADLILTSRKVQAKAPELAGN